MKTCARVDAGPGGATLRRLASDVRACTLCVPYLPLGPRPVVQVDARARILIAGQAPGRKTHESGVPFDDASGERLRRWMGVDADVFYDAAVVAIVPMGFCYPGKGRSGDLPPRRECAPQWRERLLSCMPRVELRLVIGKYAQHWHLPHRRARSLTGTVRAWRDHWPAVLPLPHPSPRNNGWFAANPWFDEEQIPELQRAVRTITKER